MPRFDSAPIFAALLHEAGGGEFRVGPASGSRGRQRYLPNTNVLETVFSDDDGSFRVLDFAPRFVHHGRSFRPTKLIRILEPVSGAPRVRVACSPVLGWSRATPDREAGSHHVEYLGYDASLRLTTDVPLSYLDGRAFVLTDRRHLVLAWGAPVEEPLEPLCERFLVETERYWRTWVKHCQIPPLYQEQVIRSALALKLHCYEDTGAIVASPTTSIPESPGSGRAWDYRYCWLRDAYYALGAFRLLGHFEEREAFLHFLLNVAASAPGLELAPLYCIDGRPGPPEVVLDGWPGFGGDHPVRVGNAAASQKQYDVFGEMVLALTPMFLDARFAGQVTRPVLDLVLRLSRKAVSVAGLPDAGIWEYRGGSKPRTFSALMCWAAADRMVSIAARHEPAHRAEFEAARTRIRAEILARGVHPTGGYLVADYDGTEVDAAALQAATLRLLPRDDPRLHATIDAIVRDLDDRGWLRRYRQADDFGRPEVAFTLCTFWLADALACVGRRAEAARVMEQVAHVISPLGLLSEDLDPTTGTMWGNFPQAYSHVGLIHAAFSTSPRWAEIE